MSDEHFTVDGTLIQAWASHKSFKQKNGSDDDGTNFDDQKRSSETHASTTDPDARLDRIRMLKGFELRESVLFAVCFARFDRKGNTAQNTIFELLYIRCKCNIPMAQAFNSIF